MPSVSIRARIVLAFALGSAACIAPAGDSGGPVFASPESGAQPPTPDGGQLANPPRAADEAEAKVLKVIAELAADPEKRYLAISEDDGRLLRALVEAANAKRVVEIGTSTGYSGLWIALALRSTGGQLVTHELDRVRAEQARENFAKAGVGELVTIVVGDAHETVKRHTEPIDVLFLDADKQGYVDYLEKLRPLLQPGALVVAHNMHQPEPDPRYVEKVTSDPELETIFLLMEGAGMAITLKKR